MDQLRNESKDFDDLADAVIPLWRVSLLNRMLFWWKNKIIFVMFSYRYLNTKQLEL